VYEVDLEVDPDAGRVTGEVVVDVLPPEGEEHLLFRLWPNGGREGRAGVRATVTGVEVDGGGATTASPDDTMLVVHLPDPVDRPADEDPERVTVSMRYELVVPGPVEDRVSNEDGSLRLGVFLPLLAWDGEGWAEDDATTLFAEPTTSPVADFDVRLAVPEGWDVLATGVADGDGRWTAEAVRDWAATIGRFDLASQVVDAPDPVEVTVGVAEGIGESPQAYLDRVVAALVQFADRFGPYPWPTLTLAITPGLRGGIEMPMHIMQGPETIGRTTPHEVAHMWFYGLVGNNQAADPWVDEAVASYAEATFEGALDDFRAVEVPEVGLNRVGAPLWYWVPYREAYYTSVYTQGAVAIADLGPPHLVDCALAHLVAEHAHDVVSSEELVAALAEVFPGAPDALAAVGVPPPDG
jgi:hypothetical protein